ncbi:MAG: cation transporter, partial [candidate division Zixibacteria bacterium]|nr:cation transporter [candidate division Zixibacteria bacterium]
KTPSERDVSAGMRVTWVGLIVNVGLIVLKLWIGMVSRSQALIADGIHSISDLFSDLLTLFGLRWGRKAADASHPYGHARIETGVGLIIGLLLLGAAVGIAFKGVTAIFQHRIVNPSMMTIIVAAVSIVAKEGMYWYTIIIGRRLRSLILVANAWHHRTDAFSSVAVLIGVLATYVNPAWYWADSLAALVVSVFIVKVAVSLIWRAFREVIDTAPDANIVDHLTRCASSVAGVRGVHDIKARYFGPHIFVEVHVVVDPTLTVKEGHAIAKQVEACLIADVGDVSRVITHVDPDTDDNQEPQL